jgi:ABC-2 type transport system permease protein
MELLLTYPFNEVELVLAKVISTFLIYFIFLFFALLYLVIFIFFYSFLNKGFIDFGNTWSGFLGLILLVLAIISLSVYISTLFNDVVPAWIVSLVIVLFLWIIGYMADLMPIKVKNILTTISLSSNFDNFSKGVIDLKNVVFFLVFSLLFIYLAITNLIDRK